MKVLKSVFLVVGLLAIAGAAAMLVKNAWDLRILYEVAMANKSQPSVVNPTNLVLIGAGVGVIGGVLLGLGIGMPRRTANAVRHQTIEDLHRQTTADAAVAAAAVTDPVAVTEPAAAAVTDPADAPHTEPTA